MLFYNPSEYYRHYILEYFRDQELERRTPLVYALKSGELKVKKGDVEDKYRAKHKAGRDNPGVEKRINVEGTKENPDLLLRFKADKQAKAPGTLDNDALIASTGGALTDLDQLLERVLNLQPGAAAATGYERAVEALLSALFYPELVNPIRQRAIHAGRKVIYITFTNLASAGFFYWLSAHYLAANVVVNVRTTPAP